MCWLVECFYCLFGISDRFWILEAYLVVARLTWIEKKNCCDFMFVLLMEVNVYFIVACRFCSWLLRFDVTIIFYDFFFASISYVFVHYFLLGFLQAYCQPSNIYLAFTVIIISYLVHLNILPRRGIDESSLSWVNIVLMVDFALEVESALAHNHFKMPISLIRGLNIMLVKLVLISN